MSTIVLKKIKKSIDDYSTKYVSCYIHFYSIFQGYYFFEKMIIAINATLYSQSFNCSGSKYIEYTLIAYHFILYSIFVIPNI